MKKKILIIDDDLGTRSFLKHMLKNKFDIETCSNGYEAVQWLESGNFPDLMISDLFMPGLHGIDLVKFVRSSGFFRKTSFVLLTGNDDKDMKAFAYEAGVTLYLQKPFEPHSLVHQIVNLLTEDSYADRKRTKELVAK